jgi:hypothetical protein
MESNLAILDQSVVKAALIGRVSKHAQVQLKSDEPNRP